MNQVVKANIFIVPNMPYVFGSDELSDSMIAPKIKHFGYSLKTGDVLYQIWTVSPERPEDKPEEWSENWADHDMPKNLKDDFRWPGFFPEALLPKEEGESVTISTENHQYELTANQTEYRYARFGKFGEVKKSLKEKLAK